MADLTGVTWPPAEVIKTDRLTLRPTPASDRAGIIELQSSPDVRENIADADVILITQVANERSLRLANRLGFIEMDRFTLHDAVQWFGVRDL